MSPHARQFDPWFGLPLLAVPLCAFALAGCAMFPAGDTKNAHTAGRRVLPPIQTSPEAIQLEIFFLERPADDPLLTTGIWKDVDEAGALSMETRESLRLNGFRVAQVSSNPPPSVQKMLGLMAEISSDSSEYSKPLMGRHQFLAPGVEAEIPTGIRRDRCEVVVRDKDETKTLEYEQVNCVFRTTARRLQDGWVRVEFQPEIHHGEKRLRNTPSEFGWTSRAGQNVERLINQRFHVMLNVGETVIVTSTEDDESIGDRFFRYEVTDSMSQLGVKKQRILFVRIVDSGRPTSVAAK